MTDETENLTADAGDNQRPSQKAAHDPFRLRAEPPRVVRLSRKVLAGLVLITGLAIGGAVIFALQSHSQDESPDELYTTDNQPTADELQRLPSDYTDIPQLGPALPGDLGRPIRRAQEEGRPVPATVLPGPDQDAQQQLAEQEAARTSAVFFTTSGQMVQSGGPASNGTTTAFAPQSSMNTGIPTAQESQSAFLNAPIDRQTTATDRITPPASPYVLQAGAVIPAALITGIRSDLPGQITAQVTQNVYDSPSGRYLLVPQGTRLIGAYDNSIDARQRRVLLVWTRLILPDGSSIVLERQPGADGAGFAGLEDGVDNHWWDIAKAAGMSALLSVTTELASDDSDDLISALADGAQDTVNEAGQQIVSRQLDIAPTLTIRPGFPVRVIVTRDLILEPQREE